MNLKWFSCRLVLLALTVMAVAVMGAGCSAAQEEQLPAQVNQDEQLQLVEDAMQRVLQAVDYGKPEKVVFSEDMKLAMDEQEIGFIFSNTVVRNAIANKFGHFYREKDADGLLAFLAFLDSNHAAGLLGVGQTFDICFSDAYIADLKQYIMENGVYLKTDGENEIYSYGGSEFWLSSIIYIKYNYELDGKAEKGTVVLGGTEYRLAQHDAYSEDSAGYFLVDQTAELIVSQFTASEKESGNCNRCDGTGKVTKIFGVSWNQKEGYRYGERCGLCNGTGWKD